MGRDRRNESDVKQRNTVLFLCTGNYYRSRFAEAVFNSSAREALPSWRGRSRALSLERGALNYGPVSPAVLLGLEALGIAYDEYGRPPQQVTESDLEQADLLVALKESEHRPLIQERYPRWIRSVEYWNIDDVDRAAPAKTMRDIERKVAALVRRLSVCGSSVSRAFEYSEADRTFDPPKNDA
jgi:protein-tyrosine phosphatase